ncbi:MAG: hypothetical protein D4R97_00115 [Bacteroidetes bacterium]|nr:MAG: hypothetical protein D4R97_00115 [Bacteroidota bacterium]
MSNKKISAFPAATSLAGTELIPIVQDAGNRTMTPNLIKDFLNVDGIATAFMGVAMSGTDPGSPTGPQYWIAGETGTFTHFAGLVVVKPIAFLIWSGSAWSKYEPDIQIEMTLINHIGEPGKRGFGVGICPPELLGEYNALHPGEEILPINGTYDITSSNYGNYQVSHDGSIMVWNPFAWGKKNADNTGDIKPEGYFIDEATANAAGYFLPRVFINGGVVQRGKFIDKYKPSLTGITASDLDASGSLANKGVASSIKLGNPISSSSETKRLNPGSDNLFAGSFSNCRANGQTPVDVYAGAIGAIKSRGDDYIDFVLFDAEWLRFLTQIHKQAAIGTANCAFNDISPSEPRGNNYYGVDYYDSGVTYAACDDAFWGAKTAPMEARKNGGGSPFAKTTHNGQDSGICIDCNQYEFLPGVTCIAESAQAITAITRAAQAVVTVTNAAAANSNYANGKPVQIEGTLTGEWATLLKSKLFTISDIAGNTFKIKNKTGAYVDTSALTVDYAANLTSLTGKFYILKESVDLKNVTSGTSGATDLWGATGVAAMYNEIDVDFCGTFGQLYGNSANQVFSGEVDRAVNAYKVSAAGLPMNKDSYGGGTSLMGNDYCYIYIANQLAPLGVFSWDSDGVAGVGARIWDSRRSHSDRGVSFRGGLLIG